MPITKEIPVEELVKLIPQSVSYLMDKGIRCIQCGESIWGTLEEASKEKGFSDKDIVGFVNDLNRFLE